MPTETATAKMMEAARQISAEARKAQEASALKIEATSRSFHSALRRP